MSVTAARNCGAFLLFSERSIFSPPLLYLLRSLFLHLSVLQRVVQLRPPLRPDESHSRPRQLPVPFLLFCGLEQQDRRPARRDAEEITDFPDRLPGVLAGVDPEGRVAVVEGGGDAVGLEGAVGDAVVAVIFSEFFFLKRSLFFSEVF